MGMTTRTVERRLATIRRIYWIHGGASPIRAGACGEESLRPSIREGRAGEEGGVGEMPRAYIDRYDAGARASGQTIRTRWAAGSRHLGDPTRAFPGFLTLFDIIVLVLGSKNPRLQAITSSTWESAWHRHQAGG